MTLKEYLTAHEGEQGLPETLHGITPEQAMQKLAAQSVDLTDEELALVAGGIEFQSDSNEGNCEVWGRDNRGRDTHWREKKTGRIFHYECPRCGGLLHLGTMGVLYCDPCNTWYWGGWVSYAKEVTGWYSPKK